MDQIVLGHGFKFQVVQGPPCPGLFSGTGTFDSYGKTMTGVYRGSDSCNGLLRSDLFATRR